jgi:hypothetical protein
MAVDVKQIGEQVGRESSIINRIRTEIHKSKSVELPK